MSTPTALKKLHELHLAGQREAAEAACRAFLADHPRNPDALWLLGSLCYESDRAHEALVLIGRAMALARAAGRTPPLDWWLCLGALQQQQGAPLNALKSFRGAATKYPGSAMARFCLATAFHSLGRTSEAAENYRAALKLDPNNAEAASNLGLILLETGRAGAAERAFRHALAQRPDFPDALMNYGSLLQRTGRLREARAILARAAKAQPDDPSLQQVLAQNETFLGNISAAAARVEAALTRHGPRPDLLSQLASIRLFQGRRDAAIELCDQALAIDRSCASALYYLAAAEYELDNPERMEDVRRSMVAPGLAAKDRALLFFAGGDRLDAMQQYGEAFSWYRQGNELRVQMLAALGTQYEPARHEAQVNGLMERFDEKAFLLSAGGSGPVTPVFIVGMPRSGTSLIEQIVSAHAEITGAGELVLVGEGVNLFARTAGYPQRLPGPAKLTQFAKAYIDRLSQIGPGKRYVTDKNPTNFQHLGLIALAFPNARIIHCRRDERDVALSCYFQNFVGSGQPFSYDLKDLAHYQDTYQRLMSHWQRVLPLPTIEIDYEAVVADQEAETRRLLEFLGLDWDPACLDFQSNRRPVITASHTQVRQPIYTRSVGRWRNYAHEMGFATVP